MATYGKSRRSGTACFSLKYVNERTGVTWWYAGYLKLDHPSLTITVWHYFSTDPARAQRLTYWRATKLLRLRRRLLIVQAANRPQVVEQTVPLLFSGLQ